MPDPATTPEVLEDNARRYDGARQVERAESYDAAHHLDGANVSAAEEDLVLHAPPGQNPSATVPQNANLGAEDVDATQFYGQEKQPKDNVGG